MNAPIALLLLGGVLTLIAIIGGGFEIKEVKIPKVDRLPRVISGFSGVLLILAGMTVSEARNSEPGQLAMGSATHAREPQAVSFLIKTQLSDNQESEQSRILIDGSVVGDLSINSQFPEGLLRVTVPTAGRYSYTVGSTLVFKEAGKLMAYDAAGQGMIVVEPGKVFELQAAPGGSGYVITIAE